MDAVPFGLWLSLWPVWGYDGKGNQDLTIGGMGGGAAPGYRGYCTEGATYTSPPGSQWCGGHYNWGETDLEIWRRADDPA